MIENNNIIDKPDQKGKKFRKRPENPKYLKTLETLQEKFPEAFPVSETRILKVGIHKDIKEQTELNRGEIFMFLRKYCNSGRYRKAHIEGAYRYDLNGVTTEVVTAEEVTKKIKPKFLDQAK